jgi:hypothetical protein
VKLFIDESLSPRIAERLNKTGMHDAIHPLHVGRRAIQNARDFRRLTGKAKIHPGLIIVPPVDREGTWCFLQTAIAYLAAKGEAADVIVNHVLEVDESGRISIFALSRP